MEIWKPIHGIRFEASSLGRIRREDGKVYTPVLIRGYHYVGLRYMGAKHMHRVHRLVCLAFNGLPRGPVVRHLNGDKFDNRPENLCWGTVQDNSDDAKRLGEVLKGSDHPNAVGTDSDAAVIRSRYLEHMVGRNKAEGHFITKLCKEFGYTYKTTYRMCRGTHHCNN